MPHNNSMQRTALRAAADAGRSAGLARRSLERSGPLMRPRRVNPVLAAPVPALLRSAAGRCPIKPRNSGHLYVRPLWNAS
jgi:hypothetical protein